MTEDERALRELSWTELHREGRKAKTSARLDLVNKEFRRRLLPGGKRED